MEDGRVQPLLRAAQNYAGLKGKGKGYSDFGVLSDASRDASRRS